MRHRSDNPFLKRLGEILSAGPGARPSRIKLSISAIVLAVVFVIAGYRQFGPSETDTPESVTKTTGRAVYGQGPSPVDEIPGPPPPEAPQAASDRTLQMPQTVTRARAGVAGAPAELQSFLNSWRTTLMSGDTSAHANLYASRVDRFFTQRNVSRRDVRREKERMVARYPEFRKYDLSDIQVESLDDARAVVTFRKDWDARGRGQFAGSERQRLRLRKDSGSWKIVGEEETKVYWVRRR